MTKNRTVNFLTGPSFETLAGLAIALSHQPLPKGEDGGQLLDLGSNSSIGGTLSWTTASIVLILLCCCCVCAPEMHLRPGCCARADPSLLILVPPSISKPPSISLSRWPSVSILSSALLPPFPAFLLRPQSSALVAAHSEVAPRGATQHHR